MTPERWARLKELFERALSVAPENREEFMRSACGDDTTLHRSLLALLGHHGRTGSVDFPTLTLDGLAQLVIADRRAFVPGELVANRFRVERFLGEGGMGEVYAAEDCELGDRVALKTIRPELARDENMLARFKQEVALTRKITHRNVSRVYDLFIHHVELFDERRTVVCLSMELLLGETLAEHLRRKGPPWGRYIRAIALQLADGLDAAHRAGVIHRDFKSANVVLIAGPGYLERVVIVDFGLASTLRVAEDATTSGRIIGTPAYMAPEQVEDGPITTATDIYALGVVLFELTTGALPFRGNSPIETARLRLSQDAPSVRSVMPFASAAWDDTIRACLQRDPAARPSSVGEVQQRLTGRYQSSADMQERANRTSEQLRRKRRFKKSRALALAAAMACGVFYWTQRPDAPSAEALAAVSSARLKLQVVTRARFRDAVADYQRAIALDPAWALPWAELAAAHAITANAQHIPMAVGRWEARAAAQRALQLDGRSAAALGALGWARSVDFDAWPSAEVTLQRAIHLDPDDGRLHHWLGVVFRRTGRFADAVDAGERALQLTGRADWSYLAELALLYWTTGQLDRMSVFVTELRDVHPNVAHTPFLHARLLKEQGHLDEAIIHLRFSERLGFPAMDVLAEHASLEAYRGDRTAALQLLEFLERATDRGAGVDPLLVAGVYAKVGDADAAIGWLERGYERGDVALLSIATNPALKPLRGDQRFVALCQKLHYEC